MAATAVLLVDLQRDFLGAAGARMPVDAAGAAAVLHAANAVLAGRVCADARPILVVNRFPASARLANRFRHGAAIAGSAGAELDPRLESVASVPVIAKSRPSAFSNPALDALLRAHRVDRLVVLGVFAEGCVRATAVDGVRRGYAVEVVADAVASNAPWKKRFALWAMRRAGVRIVPGLDALPAAGVDR